MYPSYELWIQVIKICPCRVISCDTWTTPVGSVDGSVVGRGDVEFLYFTQNLKLLQRKSLLT